MTRNLFIFLLLAFALIGSGEPVLAHHSEAAEYDSSNPVKVTGVLTKVEWQNPHIWFYVDVKDDSGKVTTWGFSSGPPGSLMRRSAVVPLAEFHERRVGGARHWLTAFRLRGCGSISRIVLR